MAKRQAAKRSAGTRSTARKRRAKAKKPPASDRPTRTSYTKAVAAYERGLRAVHQHRYAEARDALSAILTDYPEERELHDRVRLYLQVCERELGEEQPEAPESVEDRLYAATVALNAGDQPAALALLQSVQSEEPDNDHALYMLGITQSVGGDPEAGLEYLRRAIELNPENRALARHAPELETLRTTDGFKHLLEATASPGRRTRGHRSR